MFHFDRHDNCPIPRKTCAFYQICGRATNGRITPWLIARRNAGNLGIAKVTIDHDDGRSAVKDATKSLSEPRTIHLWIGMKAHDMPGTIQARACKLKGGLLMAAAIAME